MRRYVKDGYGQKYWIKVLEDSNDFFHVELGHRGEYVGEVKCALRLPETMELIDTFAFGMTLIHLKVVLSALLRRSRHLRATQKATAAEGLAQHC